MCWKHPAGPCPGPGPTGWTGYHQERRVGKPGALSAGPPKALRFSAAQNSWLQKWVAGSLNEALVSGFQVRLFACLILSPNFSGPGVGWATCLLDMFKKCITMVQAHFDFFVSKSVLVGAVLGNGITGITRIPKPCIAGIQASCGQRLRHVLRIIPWFDWWRTGVLWAEQVSRTCFGAFCSLKIGNHQNMSHLFGNTLVWEEGQSIWENDQWLGPFFCVNVPEGSIHDRIFPLFEASRVADSVVQCPMLLITAL